MGSSVVYRRKFARHDCSQQCTKVRTALGSENGFKLRLRLEPFFSGRLEALLAYFIPNPIDQNRCAQSRMAMAMIVQG